ncbi:GNAT family N-acetyltransferase [Leptospira kanakyensis]|uniref:GNAT family N-acetyltransferase n=1 Tax=Leptospira kanakyensis TaxID=2484968 RepID=UPI00223DB368|nr:GNAT family N-acetyltransferase [Leptospira kanakyensis]MCW7482115.1 GNAT family N-acetyltransferase [Leptospira kanakyensis]
MKFPYSPLPSWKNIFSSLFQIGKGYQVSFDRVWCKDAYFSLWFSKTAWSFVAIAIWKKIASQKENITFWFPDYFCDSALTILRKLNVRIVFYPIDENREPDFQACKRLLSEEQVDVFVFVHYFGQPSNATKAFEFCFNHKASLIEDCAHVLRPIAGIGEKGDFILYSPHKHFPIPDGACVVVKEDGPSRIQWNDQLTKVIEDEVRKFASQVEVNKCHSVQWFIKRIAQKLGLKSKHKSVPFLFDRSHNSLIKPFLSRISKIILNQNLGDIEIISLHKSKIKKLWLSLFLNSETTKEIEESNWTPYLSEVKFSNLDEASKNFEMLVKANFPVSSWPDLPVEVKSNFDLYHRAHLSRNTSVFFSTHFSISQRDLSLLGCYNEPVSEIFPIKNIELSQVEWEFELALIKHMNLLQAWFYGDAKSNIERWNVKRYLLRSKNRKIALVQTLSKSVLGLFKVIRINRGPLFFTGVTDVEKKSVFEYLKNSRSLFSLLFINPELEDSAINLKMIHQVGFYPRKLEPWSSSIHDLSQDLSLIKKNLDSKWRRALKSFDKSNLTLKISVEKEDFKWLEEKHSEHMTKKNFEGISIELLSHLINNPQDKETLVMLIAQVGDEKIACVCLSLTYNIGTYLIGWNSDAGRQNKSHYYLLWNALVYLKENSFSYFDLGGIDEVNTPSIASFKIGLNGKRYRLVGEFFKFL